MLQVTLLDTSTYAVAIQAHVRIVSYVVAGPEGEGHLLAGMASIEDEDLAAVGRDADRVEDTRHAQPLLHRLLPAPCPRPCRSVVTPGSAMRLTACRFLRSNSCPFLRSNSAARAMRGRYLRIRHLRIRYLRIRYLRIEAPLWHLRCRLAGWTRPGGGGGSDPFARKTKKNTKERAKGSRGSLHGPSMLSRGCLGAVLGMVRVAKALVLLRQY